MNARAWLVLAALALVTTGGVERKAATLNNDANKVYEAKKFEAAAKLYDEAQTRAPDSPEISYNLGNTLYRQGRMKDAVSLLQRGAQSQDPRLRQQSLYNLGNALHGTGKLQEAVTAYRQALTLDPRDRDAKINYEKALQELEQQKKQPQDQQQQDKNQNQNQKQDQKKQPGQGQSGQGNPQQDQQQQGRQDPQEKNQDQQKPGDEGQPQDQKPGQEGEKKPQNGQDQPPQMAGFDSSAAGDLSREEAMRILEAMRQQETELQKERARQQKIRTRRVDKDW